MFLRFDKMGDWALAGGAVIVLIGVIVGLSALASPIAPTDLPDVESKDAGPQAEGKTLQETPEVRADLSQTTPAREVTLADARSQGYSFCGDGVCDASESCSACQKDCGCSSIQFCTSSGVCQEKEVVGDGVCTEKEKAEASCSDCGCGEESICSQFTDKCIAKVRLSEGKAREVTDAFLKENPSYRLAGVYDSYVGSKAVKAFSFDCSEQYYCRVEVLVNSTGDVVGKEKTS